MWEIDEAERRTITEYDEGLGWKGVPSATIELATECRRFTLTHNAQGYRDIEESQRDPSEEAVVFLGDSFAWGLQVEADEMFVNLLRERLPDFEVYNLAHGGYGTDQELLTFERWQAPRPIRLVVLMFCENDFGDNSNSIRYGKPKPRFVLEDGRLVLTNVPVPRAESRDPHAAVATPPSGFKQHLKHVLLHSHILHAVHYAMERRGKDGPATVTRHIEHGRGDPVLAARILERLRERVAARGARLVVVAIPSKLEFMKGVAYTPYEGTLEGICRDLKLPCLNLAHAIGKSLRRCYYRQDMHWNAHGNAVAADAIHDFLKGLLRPSG